MDRTCPHCGQDMPRMEQKLHVTGRERKRLVGLLLRAPDGLTREALAARLWADDPDGGPNNTLAVCQLVHQARLQLRTQGYTIVSDRGPGAHYRIVRWPPEERST